MELKNADNLHIFKQVQSVPEDAQKPFESPWGKRLTEIDPMWRIEQADTWNRWQPSGADDCRRSLRR